MCTIMTTTGSLTTIPEFEEAFALTKYRGPDDTRIISIDHMMQVASSETDIPVSCPKGIMGFHRLSIMGLTPEGMQPFVRNGCSVVCNGELYGFESMKKYKFKYHICKNLPLLGWSMVIQKENIIFSV